MIWRRQTELRQSSAAFRLEILQGLPAKIAVEAAVDMIRVKESDTSAADQLNIVISGF